jgi:hypothetical protein
VIDNSHTFLPILEAEGAKLTPISQALFARLSDEFCALEKHLAYYEAPSVQPIVTNSHQAFKRVSGSCVE